MPDPRKARNLRRFRSGRIPIPAYLDVRLFGRLELLKLTAHQTWAELLTEMAANTARARAQRRRRGLPLRLGTGDGPMPSKPKTRPGLPENLPSHGSGAVL